MSRNDIIRMAAQVESEITGHDFPHSYEFIEWCERFAALVAAAEREECAKICDLYDYSDAATECADAIRARGKE